MTLDQRIIRAERDILRVCRSWGYDVRDVIEQRAELMRIEACLMIEAGRSDQRAALEVVKFMAQPNNH